MDTSKDDAKGDKKYIISVATGDELSKLRDALGVYSKGKSGGKKSGRQQKSPKKEQQQQKKAATLELLPAEEPEPDAEGADAEEPSAEAEDGGAPQEDAGAEPEIRDGDRRRVYILATFPVKTTQNISAGREILVSYGRDYWRIDCIKFVKIDFI